MKKAFNLIASITSILLGLLSCYIYFILWVAISVAGADEKLTSSEIATKFLIIIMLILSIVLIVVSIVCIIIRNKNKKKINRIFLALLCLMCILYFVLILINKGSNPTTILIGLLFFIPIIFEVLFLTIQKKESIQSKQ